MGMNEADTRVNLIDPRLHDAGWGEALIEREYLYKAGRVRLIGEQTMRDPLQKVDYVLSDQPGGLALAVLEAKDEGHTPGAGLQQAMAYAVDMGVSFAYASNGHGIVEHDFLTGTEQNVASFPPPEKLRARLRAGKSMRGPRVLSRKGIDVDNPLITPARSLAGQSLRYYQERAVTAAIEQMLLGRTRALLALATGTGKTFIAFNIAWKLRESGYAQKILFLADRVNLQNQAFNEFGPFGEARGMIKDGLPPLARDVHFSIYQALYVRRPDGTRLFEDYPPDYFDLIIVDECHRSGYGDWQAILDRFGTAFHLGMTATPKRTDSVNTYEFFAGENRDEHDQPQPAYEYSLGQGIDDGFLATYKVHRVKTNIDQDGLHIEDEVARGAELIIPDGADVQDVYGMAEFERAIVVPDRTQLLCADLAGKLRTYGVDQKTMVFCVTMEHAEQVRKELQSLLGPETGKQLYAARIVSEERDAIPMLEAFQLSASQQPVVATTVDLLTTGVNVPACRNIVFMKTVGSPTVFKQIVGRGSRLDPATGKEFFRIIDYTNATRLFDDWDVPPPDPVGDLPTEGDGILAGHVIDSETKIGVEEASISVRLGMGQLRQVQTGAGGEFTITGLPEIPLGLVIAASGYMPKQTKEMPSSEPPELAIELRQPQAGAKKVEISGVQVTIAEEIELVLGGQELTVTQYCDYVGEKVRTQAGDSGTLAEVWRDPHKRQQLRSALREEKVDPAILALLLNRPDADEFDLLAHVAYAEQIRSREQRARELEEIDLDFIGGFEGKQREVVDALIDKYRLAGVEEIASAQVFGVPPFINEFGGVAALAQLFGGADHVRDLLRAIQERLYPAAEEAA